ncbi:nucleotidyltransferase domain-containing protein [bacterium]|nr:nucleotidyltransferase domain-containing protein [bacterium]
MTKLFLKETHLEILKDIFTRLCPNATVYAYGSRIKGNAHEGSDLDLALDNTSDDVVISDIVEAVRESNIPFLIDIFELKSLPESFQNEIMKNNVVIFGAK